MRVLGTRALVSGSGTLRRAPSTIAEALGAKLRLQLTDGSLVGSPVSAWTDLSPTAMSFAQPTLRQRPAVGAINGLPAADFDGTDDLMTGGGSGKLWQDLSGGAATGAVEWWVVCQPDTAAAAPSDYLTPYTLPAVFSIASAWGELIYTAGGFVVALNDGTNKNTLPIASPTGQRVLVNIRHDGTTLRLAVGTTVSAGVACGPCGAGAQQLILGCAHNGAVGTFFDGKMGCIVAANGAAVTPAERAAVNSILAARYGVAA